MKITWAYWIKTENKIYKQLDKLDEKVGKLIQIYCVIELDELYEIYKKLYQKKQGKEEFFRYIYWHARFNDLLMTYYQDNGTAYAAMKGLNIYEIIEKEISMQRIFHLMKFQLMKLTS